MRSLLTINIFFLFISFSKDSDIQNNFVNSNKYFNKIPKSKFNNEVDSTKYLLHNHTQHSYNINNRFSEINSYCKLKKNTLIFQFGHFIWGASNMKITIINDSSKINFCKSDCLTFMNYKTLYSKVELEKRKYSVGDTIELKVSYKGFGQYYEDQKSDKDDTVEVSGKIRLKIKNRKYSPKF